jgi:hypothetical protein
MAVSRHARAVGGEIYALICGRRSNRLNLFTLSIEPGHLHVHAACADSAIGEYTAIRRREPAKAISRIVCHAFRDWERLTDELELARIERGIFENWRPAFVLFVTFVVDFRLRDLRGQKIVAIDCAARLSTSVGSIPR